MSAAMEEISAVQVERTGKIMRRSIYTFLQQYQYFTSTAAVLALPFSVSVLLSQAFIPSVRPALFLTIHARLRSLFEAAGFPPSSDFFSVLNLKLSQTISSSIFTLSFTLSFLLLAKAFVIQVLHPHKPIPSIPSLYKPLLHTYICNMFFILSANASVFSILLFAFSCLEGFGLSSPNSLLFLSTAGAILYSIILANALMICNLALVLAGMERRGGHLAILEACVMMKGRASMALSLALPPHLGMAAVEALFQYRIVRPFYHLASNGSSSMALEGLFIAYLYSILIVLDTIVSCKFFRSCRGRYYHEIRNAGDSKGISDFAELKTLEELP